MSKENKRKFAFTVEVTYRIPVEVDAEDIGEAKKRILEKWRFGQMRPDMECDDQVTNICATPEGWRYGQTMEDIILMPEFMNYRREGI